MTLSGASFSQQYNPTNLTLTAQAPANQAPTVAGIAVSTNEDAVFTFSAAIFDASFGDGNGDTLQSVRVDTLPATGTLKLSGTNVTAGQVIARAGLGNLTFTPAAQLQRLDQLPL